MRRCDPAGLARARAALADGELVRAMNGEGALVAGWLALLAADDPLALDSLDAAVAQAHLNGSLRAIAAAYCFRAAGRLWSGQLADAETDARAALRLTGSGRVDMDPSFAGAYLAGALLERGELDEAVSVLHSLGIPAAEPADRPRYYALDLWARILLLQGRYAESLATARVAGEVWQAYGFVNPALGCWRSVAAESAYHLGTPEPDLVETELALARRWGAPRGLGRVLRTAGVLAADRDLLRESVEVLEKSPARLDAVGRGAVLRVTCGFSLVGLTVCWFRTCCKARLETSATRCARCSVVSRARLVITAVTAQGLSQAEAARTWRSEATVSRLMARYRTEGRRPSSLAHAARRPPRASWLPMSSS